MNLSSARAKVKLRRPYEAEDEFVGKPEAKLKAEPEATQICERSQAEGKYKY